MVTGEIKKEKYVYYRCTGHRGKCALPRFREEDLALRLGEPLKGLQVPPEVVKRIVSTLQDDAKQSAANVGSERSRLEARLTSIRDRMDRAYLDKLDGKIPADYLGTWNDRLADAGTADADGDSRSQRGQIRRSDARRSEDLELANSAYSLYLSQDSTEKAKLLRMLLWNCSIDAVSATPVYRKPFDMIFKRVQKEEWSGRLDSN